MNSKLLLLVCVTLLTGCGPKLSHTKDYPMAVGEIIEIPLDAISKQQTIKIVASSPGKPINVYVYLAEHAEEVNRNITLGKPAQFLLADKSDAEQVSLDATVPAGKSAIVRLQPAGPTSAQVHLEITN